MCRMKKWRRGEGRWMWMERLHPVTGHMLRPPGGDGTSPSDQGWAWWWYAKGEEHIIMRMMMRMWWVTHSCECTGGQSWKVALFGQAANFPRVPTFALFQMWTFISTTPRFTSLLARDNLDLASFSEPAHHLDIDSVKYYWPCALWSET